MSGRFAGPGLSFLNPKRDFLNFGRKVAFLPFLEMLSSSDTNSFELQSNPVVFRAEFKNQYGAVFRLAVVIVMPNEVGVSASLVPPPLP